MSDVSLTASIRRALLQLQKTHAQIDTNQQRLASGKKVSAAIDDPVSFYQSKKLYENANSLSNYKDNIDQGISTLKASVQGLDSYNDILKQIKGLAEQAKNASTTQQASLQAAATTLLAQAKNLLYDTSLNGTNLIYQTRRGVNFNGSSDYVLPGRTNIAAGSDKSFTFATWVNTTSDSWLISNTDVSALRISGGKALLQLFMNSSTGTYVSGNTNVADGNWHRVVGVHDGVNNLDSIYVDGKLDGTPLTNTSTLGANVGFNTGGARSSGSQNTDPSVDDMQYWNNGAWNASDAAYDYATGNTPDGRAGTSLLANQLDTRLQFSEGSGTTTANLGTAGGMAPIVNQTGTFWTGASSASQPFSSVLTVQLSDANSYTVQGVDMSPEALGINLSFQTANLNATIASLGSAISQVNAQMTRFSNDFSLLQTRLNYTKTYVNTLQEAGDKLTLADLNEEAANSLALNTRQQLGVNSLSLAAQMQQAILSLFQ